MNRRALTVLTTGLAVFAMFFGAGNLILPTMIGAEAGRTAPVAIIGFLLTGVALPALSMIALSTKREEEPYLAVRLGARLGLVTTAAIYLGCGMVYAIPRVGAVSYEMTLAPFVPDGPIALLAFTAVFFGAAYLLTRRPSRIVAHVGGWLTPVLLVLLAVLVIAALGLPVRSTEPVGAYASSPGVGGFVQGYFTMDGLAAQLFGGIALTSLLSAGMSVREARRGTLWAALIAAVLLMAVYLGLVHVGRVGVGENGAALISNVSRELFGVGGQVLFGAIVLLACLTTTIGLVGASSEFFHRLVPRLSEHAWLVVTLVVSFALANLGLEAILAVVAPINQLLYPMVICLVLVALLDAMLPLRLHWSYRLPAWAAGALSIPEALWSTQAGVFAPLRTVLDAFPFGALQLAWTVPALVALVIGLVLDASGRVPDSSHRTVDAQRQHTPVGVA